MTDVSSQRRMASDLLKVGMHRVWINPEHLERVSGAITREDVRRLIAKGIMAKAPAPGTSRGRLRARVKIIEKKVKDEKGVETIRKVRIKPRRHEGSRKGKLHSIVDGKRVWINKVRPIRRYLKALRAQQDISRRDYRRLYLLAKGGFFRNRSHLKLYIGKEGLLPKKVEGK